MEEVYGGRHYQGASFIAGVGPASAYQHVVSIWAGSRIKDDQLTACGSHGPP